MKVTHVISDDWEGLYVDGVLAEEGHSIRVHDVLKALGIDGNQIEADSSWLESEGRLPTNLKDVKEA